VEAVALELKTIQDIERAIDALPPQEKTIEGRQIPIYQADWSLLEGQPAFSG
jgi:hypothetical protein